MRQFSTREQMTMKLTTLAHRTAAFINEQIPYRIVSYKGPEMTNVKLTSVKVASWDTTIEEMGT